MSTVVANGATPEVNGNHEGSIERLVREIEEVLAPLDARREQLTAELLDIDEERERLKAGIAGLTGMLAIPSESKPVTKPVRKKPGSSDVHGPSTKMLDDVYAFIARSVKEGQPDVIKDEICEALGISQSTAMDSLRRLRDQERIRLVGSRRSENDTRTGGRAPSAYTVMADG